MLSFYAEGHVSFIVMLSVVMLNVVAPFSTAKRGGLDRKCRTLKNREERGAPWHSAERHPAEWRSANWRVCVCHTVLRLHFALYTHFCCVSFGSLSFHWVSSCWMSWRQRKRQKVRKDESEMKYWRDNLNIYPGEYFIKLYCRHWGSVTDKLECLSLVATVSPFPKHWRYF